MPDEKTPLEELNAANDKYHKAIGKILLDKDLAVEVKVVVDKIADNAFVFMSEINKYLANYY